MLNYISKVLTLALCFLMVAPATAQTAQGQVMVQQHFTQALFKNPLYKPNVKNSHKPKKVASHKKKLELGRPYQVGYASWYGSPPWMRGGDGYNGGHMAGGGRMDYRKPYCAHLYLPYYTRIIVKNLDNGLMTECVIRDRGPFNSRILDMSYSVNMAIQASTSSRIAIYIEK